MWGATPQFWTLEVAMERFQSTLPVWGATARSMACPVKCRISIHAPRVGSDSAILLRCHNCCAHFNPRSPCGERHTGVLRDNWQPDFNPRSPCGERPQGSIPFRIRPRISIHAPRVGSDAAFGRCDANVLYFNPRSPCGERPRRERRNAKIKSHFNPRSPCGERPSLRKPRHKIVIISIHAPRVGSDWCSTVLP